MGIQIVSVLAKLHSSLMSSSRVELQPRIYYEDGYRCEIALPDPDEESSQYVVEVILQWSAEEQSHRPSTWRELLAVLQDIGLELLSQQIEEFLKGK